MSDGKTYFIRCAICHELWVPKSTITFGGTSSEGEPFWFRPTPRRKPVACRHPLDRVEAWNGNAWEATAV